MKQIKKNVSVCVGGMLVNKDLITHQSTQPMYNLCHEFGTNIWAKIVNNSTRLIASLLQLGIIINTHILCAEIFTMAVLLSHRFRNYRDLLELIHVQLRIPSFESTGLPYQQIELSPCDQGKLFPNISCDKKGINMGPVNLKLRTGKNTKARLTIFIYSCHF